MNLISKQDWKEGEVAPDGAFFVFGKKLQWTQSKGFVHNGYYILFNFTFIHKTKAYLCPSRYVDAVGVCYPRICVIARRIKIDGELRYYKNLVWMPIKETATNDHISRA